MAKVATTGTMGLCALALALTACTNAGLSPVAPPTPADPLSLIAPLDPPKPGEGVQIVVGPFDVPLGKEVQNNYFMKLPVDHDVFVDRIDIVYPPGSHHANLFRSDTKSVPDHVEDSFASMYPEYDMFANSQSGDLHWVFPEGVALKFNAHHQLLIQTHYVNALTQVTPTDKGLVKINLHFADPAKVKQQMGMLFSVNPSLRLPPYSTSIAQKAFSLADYGYNKDVKVVALNGHTHSRGKSFEVNRWVGRDPNVRGEQIYYSANWEEPAMKYFTTPADLRGTERLITTTTYVNRTDIFIGFGNGSVDTKEHSNMFMYFYPGPEDGKAIYDVSASQFQETREI